MTRPRSFHATRFLGRDLSWCDRHHFVPVGPIFVFNHQSQRRAECQTVANTTENLDMIRLDLHSPAAAIALLPSPQFVVDLIDIYGQTSGQTFDYRDQRATM